MAWFTFKCQEHGEFKKALPKREKYSACPKCGKDSPVTLGGQSGLSVMERLDNGAMARGVERLHNIEEIMNDRADKHTEDTQERFEPED